MEDVDDGGDSQEGEQDQPPLIDLSDDTSIDKLEIRDFEGPGDRTLVDLDGKDFEEVTVGGTIAGFDKAIIAGEVDITFHHATVVGNRIGLEARSGTEAMIVNTSFQNEFADILFFEGAKISLFDVCAGKILKIANGSAQPIDLMESANQVRQLIQDPELIYICRLVLEADDATEKERHARDLAELTKEKWDQMTDSADTAADFITLAQFLRWVTKLWIELT